MQDKIRISKEQISNAILRIERFLADLDLLNRETANESFEIDQNVRGLENAINSTLSDIFGPQTQEFRRYQARLVPVVFTNDRAQVMHSFQERIQQAVTNLKRINDNFHQMVDEDSQNEDRNMQHVPSTIVSPPGQRDSVPPRRSPSALVSVLSVPSPESRAMKNFLNKLGLNAEVFTPPNGQTRMSRHLQTMKGAEFALAFISEQGDSGNTYGDSLFILGYMAGRLGEENVCAVTSGKVVMPPSCVGIAKLAMDEVGAWQLELARILRAGGMQFDLNRVL